MAGQWAPRLIDRSPEAHRRFGRATGAQIRHQSSESLAVLLENTTETLAELPRTSVH